MTSKKHFNWFEDLAGNLITERGRFNLIETDINGLPKAKGLEQMPGNSKINFDDNKKPEIKPEVDTSLNPIEWIIAKVYHFKMEGIKKMFDAIKKILIPKIVQWLLKIAGSIFAYLGISSGTVEEIVGGVVVFILSAIWSLVSTGKIALTDPKDFLKIK